MVIIVGAGFGAPVITINRGAILLWVIICLGISILSISKKRARAQPLSRLKFHASL
jgi:hypothetical protein